MTVILNAERQSEAQVVRRVVRAVAAGAAMLAMLVGRADAAPDKEFVVKSGIMETIEGTDQLHETSVVTMDPSRRPGWCFVVEPPSDAQYEVYSVHHLPGAPNSLTGDFRDQKSASASAGIKTEVRKVTGTQSFCFGFHAGDPLGEYRVDVFINKKPKTTIHFEVSAAGTAQPRGK